MGREELRWRPADDAAFLEGQMFVERHLDTADERLMWHGWMVRQAFWCGVKWSREHGSLPILGTVGEGGRITWKENP